MRWRQTSKILASWAPADGRFWCSSHCKLVALRGTRLRDGIHNTSHNTHTAGQMEIREQMCVLSFWPANDAEDLLEAVPRGIVRQILRDDHPGLHKSSGFSPWMAICWCRFHFRNTRTFAVLGINHWPAALLCASQWMAAPVALSCRRRWQPDEAKKLEIISWYCMVTINLLQELKVAMASLQVFPRSEEP